MSLAQDSLNGSSRRSLLGQQNIFGSQEEADTIKEWDEMEILSCEKEALGFYVTGHPIMKHREKLSALHIKRTSELDSISDRDEVQVAGVISRIKNIQRRGTAETMAYFYPLKMRKGSGEAIAFPELFKNNRIFLRKTPGYW